MEDSSDMEGNTPETYDQELLALVPALACPVCKRLLAVEGTGAAVKMVCPAGHSFSRTGLLGCLNDAADDALWFALQTLNDSVQLGRELTRELYEQNHRSAARQLQMGLRKQQRRVSLLQEVLLGSELPTMENSQPESAGSTRTRPAPDRGQNQQRAPTTHRRKNTNAGQRPQSRPAQHTEQSAQGGRPGGRKRAR